MSARISIEAAADLGVRDGRRVEILGYGNQGAAQARNLRDSLYSHTSQCGRLRALTGLATDDVAARPRAVLHDDILSGRFAGEWSTVDPEEELAALRDRAERHPLTAAEHVLMNKEAHR
ncbi:hypothetical protein LWC33_31605 [Pseudonocardia sp. RS11V-5]|uniref:hypothetical protein n=1 Tax=Pseudonocardia terrae TaxID=2905831 RepID=UPI001E55FD64|nr:hypothetical protein [Pseudonocardia terrae]MCE3555978.1 hypothetical protein [Pseudonocardia terrae]